MLRSLGMNTNFHAAIDTILDVIIQSKMTPEDVQDMVLVILSDMQMDSGDKCNTQALYETIKTKLVLQFLWLPYYRKDCLILHLRTLSSWNYRKND